MSENKKNAETIHEDWAILPFNEAEDDKRWTKLIRETEALKKDAARSEKNSGEISAIDLLNDFQMSTVNEDDELF